MIVSHLLQVNGSATGNNFVRCWPSIRQLALRPDFERSAVLFPGHMNIIEWSWLVEGLAVCWDASSKKFGLSDAGSGRSRTLRPLASIQALPAFASTFVAVEIGIQRPVPACPSEMCSTHQGQQVEKEPLLVRREAPVEEACVTVI